uniref:Uncharacterized protein n=1 Tax=Anopheles merus TaxID=30066 RepID=A0A182USB1_ANOME
MIIDKSTVSRVITCYMPHWLIDCALGTQKKNGLMRNDRKISHTKRRSTACEITCCSIKPRSGYAIWHSGQQNRGDPSRAFVSRIWPGFGRGFFSFGGLRFFCFFVLVFPVPLPVPDPPFASSPLAAGPPFTVLLLELPPSGPGELMPDPATDPLFGSFLIASEYFSKCWMEMGRVADSSILIEMVSIGGTVVPVQVLLLLLLLLLLLHIATGHATHTVAGGCCTQPRRPITSGTVGAGERSIVAAEFGRKLMDARKRSTECREVHHERIVSIAARSGLGQAALAAPP